MKLSMPELLLDLAREVSLPRDLLIVPTGGSNIGEEQFRRIQFALDFARAPAALRFRAVFERWDTERIVKELY